MSKRTIEIKLRLSENEFQYLNRRVKKSGVSREGYLRHLIRDRIPPDLPPPDFYATLRELQHISRNLNQIARKAHTVGAIDVGRYDENVAVLHRTMLQLMDAIMSPRRLE